MDEGQRCEAERSERRDEIVSEDMLLYISRDLANATNAHIFLAQLRSVISHSIRLVSP